MVLTILMGKIHTCGEGIMYLCFSFIYLFLIMQGYSTLNEQMVLFIPRAVYALCVGHVPFTRCFKELPLVHNYFDVADAQDDSHKVQPSHSCLNNFFLLVIVFIKLPLKLNHDVNCSLKSLNTNVYLSFWIALWKFSQKLKRFLKLRSGALHLQKLLCVSFHGFG